MIPRTMMTQHPDAASKYIPIQKEPKEAIDALSDQPKGLGLDEVMIDFEGKMTPYQQTAQVVLGLLEKGIKVGDKVMVTPRIPSGREEGVFRQLMALMSIVESNYKALKENQSPAIKEIVLPMTLKGDELVSLQKRIIDVIELAHKEFGMNPDPVQIRPIPLVESLPAVLLLRQMLSEYRSGLKRMGLELEKMRIMLGRSDLALTYGLGAAVLSIIIALSDLEDLSKEGINVAPILGGGTLPFRGHLSLENASNFLKQYKSVETYTVQSAMRYDHGRSKTIKLASLLKKKSASKQLKISDSQRRILINCLGIFAKNYLSTISSEIPTIVKITDLIPEQRDRLARKSEVGYARQLPQAKTLAEMIDDKNISKELEKIKWKKADLPRAISFTAALYTVGIPPELIGIGRSLREIKESQGEAGVELLNTFYPSLKADIDFVIPFTNLEIGASFFKSSFMKKVREDKECLSDFFNLNFKRDNSLYMTVMETLKPMLKQLVEGNIVIGEEELENELVRELILKLASLRKALG
ncbi:MAG: phosphoenolpyruvate carboxylase [Actinobacteria bacterium]|nr:MAG: phosphoenolpyruvate carboxylase [Actinomycetota bacterium]